MKRDRRDSEQGKGPAARPSTISEKPMFHLMQRRDSLADPGFFIFATHHVTDEAGLLATLEETRLRSGQVLVAANDAALSMLLGLSVQRGDRKGTARGARPQQPTPSPKASP